MKWYDQWKPILQLLTFYGSIMYITRNCSNMINRFMTKINSYNVVFEQKRFAWFCGQFYLNNTWETSKSRHTITIVKSQCWLWTLSMYEWNVSDLCITHFTFTFAITWLALVYYDLFLWTVTVTHDFCVFVWVHTIGVHDVWWQVKGQCHPRHPHLSCPCCCT